MSNKYRTKADPETTDKLYRPRVALWGDDKGATRVQITPEVALELKRLADECLNGTLYYAENRFKTEDKHPSHQITGFTAEEREERLKKYQTHSDTPADEPTF